MPRLPKIATLRSIEEIEGFAWGASISGQLLTTDEATALEDRLSELSGHSGRERHRQALSVIRGAIVALESDLARPSPKQGALPI